MSYRKFTFSDIFFPYALYKKMRKGLEAEGCWVSQRLFCGSIVPPPCSMLSSVTVSQLAWDKVLSPDATVHPLWQRTDSPSVWYCKGTFINVSKAFRAVAVEPVQCEVTFSVL